MLNHFLDLEDLSGEEINDLLSEAHAIETRPVRDTLRGRVLGLIFLNPSLRTLASCQAGMAQLGGSSFVIQPGQGSWMWEFRDGAVMDGVAVEHVKEGIGVLQQYADVLGVRCFAEGKRLADDLEDPLIHAIAARAKKPVINLESALDHPCQALADWKTLDDVRVPRDGRFVLSWAWHPKPLPYAVPTAALCMAARRGMNVTVLRPDGFALPEPIMNKARAIAARSGGTIAETSDRATAMNGAHVIYAKSWQSAAHYGDAAGDAALRAPLRSWCVAESWFERAAKHARFMHCLPVRRNVKVADEVLDGPRSVVLEQAGNRLHVLKAVLLRLLGE